MAITTTWKYEIVKTIPIVLATKQQNVVQSYKAICVANNSLDDDKKASTVFLVDFDVDNGVEGSFIELVDLNDDILAKWTKEKLGEANCKQEEDEIREMVK